MRLSILTLIGFLSFTFCMSFCPMNMSVQAMDHADHSMHASHDAHHHGDEDQTCDHCEDQIREDVGYVPTFDSIPFANVEKISSEPLALLKLSASEMNSLSFLSGSGPPIASVIVETIVLRT